MERSGGNSVPTWNLWIDEVPRPGWTSMSIDMALLDRAEQEGEGWLRLYRWDPHCLSFGRHEPASRRYDTDRIRALGLDTVRRPTGGRTVWHATELTYAVASPCASFGTLSSAYSAYLEIHRLIRDALVDLGFEATLAPRTRVAGLDAGACFAQPVGGEVMLNGRKAVGSAQLRRGGAFLQHGSILIRDDQSLVSRLMRTTDQAESLESWAQIELLVDHRGRRLPATHVAAALARSAARRWPGAWEQVTDPDAMLSAASTYYPQFRASSWTWAR